MVNLKYTYIIRKLEIDAEVLDAEKILHGVMDIALRFNLHQWPDPEPPRVIFTGDARPDDFDTDTKRLIFGRTSEGSPVSDSETEKETETTKEITEVSEDKSGRDKNWENKTLALYDKGWEVFTSASEMNAAWKAFIDSIGDPLQDPLVMDIEAHNLSLHVLRAANRKVIDTLDVFTPHDKTNFEILKLDSEISSDKDEKTAMKLFNEKLVNVYESDEETLLKSMLELKISSSLLDAVRSIKGINSVFDAAEKIDTPLSENPLTKYVYDNAKDKVRDKAWKKAKEVLKKADVSSEFLDGVSSVLDKGKEALDLIENIGEISERQQTIDSYTAGSAKKSLTILNVASKFSSKISGLFKGNPALQTGADIMGFDKIDTAVTTLVDTIGALGDFQDSTGTITAGQNGARIPNVIHKKYGTGDPRDKSTLVYTDSEGKKTALSPYSYRPAVTSTGKQVYIPLDEYETPIGNLAIVDVTKKGWFFDDDQAILVDLKTGTILSNFDIN